MIEMNAKDRVIEAIKSLPDDAKLEDVIDRLFLLLKVQKGLEQADAGETVSQKDARERMSRWLK